MASETPDAAAKRVAPFFYGIFAGVLALLGVFVGLVQLTVGVPDAYAALTTGSTQEPGRALPRLVQFFEEPVRVTFEIDEHTPAYNLLWSLKFAPIAPFSLAGGPPPKRSWGELLLTYEHQEGPGFSVVGRGYYRDRFALDGTNGDCQSGECIEFSYPVDISSPYVRARTLDQEEYPFPLTFTVTIADQPIEFSTTVVLRDNEISLDPLKITADIETEEVPEAVRTLLKTLTRKDGSVHVLTARATWHRVKRDDLDSG